MQQDAHVVRRRDHAPLLPRRCLDDGLGAFPVGVPRLPTPGLPHGGLVAVRGSKSGVPNVLVVGAGDAGEDGDATALVGGDVPSGLVQVPEVVIDLLADLGRELLEEGRSRLRVGRRGDAVPKLMGHGVC